MRQQQQQRAHVHVEAFWLMQYRSDDGQEVEYLWNSRDGVTPFVIVSRLGTELTHHDWGSDMYLPNFRPQPGSRIFVDLTMEQAHEYAVKHVYAHWDKYGAAFLADGKTKEDMVEEVAKEFYRDGHQPTIQVVAEGEPRS